MAEPFVVESSQEVSELSLRFTHGGQSVWVRGEALVDGTTLKYVGEQVRQAYYLYLEEREACGCKRCP